VDPQGGLIRQEGSQQRPAHPRGPLRSKQHGVYVGEVVAPLLVLAGFYARVGAALIAVNMLFAIALAHGAEFFSLNQTGGWALELQGMFLLTAVALALIGPGRYGINDR
jgi:putative oxidoreductase